MKGNNSELSKLSLLQIIATIVKGGLVFFITPVFTRLLSQEEYGIVSLFASWVAIFTHVIGLKTYSSLSNAYIVYDKNDYKKYVSSNILISVVSALSITLLSFFLREPASHLLLLPENTIPLIFIQSFGLYCLTFFSIKQIQEKKQLFSIILSFVSTISAIILSVGLILVMSDGKEYGKIYGDTIIYTISGALICFIIIKKNGWFLRKDFVKFSMSISLPMMFYSLSGVILNQTDRVMIKVLKDNESVAIYNTALLLASVLTVIWQALNNTWQPFFFEYMKNGKQKEIKNHLNIFGLSFALLTVGFILVSPDIYIIWAGESYMPGVMILPYAAIGFYLLFLDGIISMYLLYKKETKKIAFGIGIAAILNILLNYLGIVYFGMNGAIYATVLSYLVCIIIHAVLLKRCGETISIEYRKQILFLLFVIASVVVVYLTKEAYYVRWCVAVIVGIILIVHVKRNKGLI